MLIYFFKQQKYKKLLRRKEFTQKIKHESVLMRTSLIYSRLK